MNEVSAPNDDDGSRLLASIAAPLMDLRDRSVNAGLNDSNVEAGDLQSQLLLAYKADVSDVFVSNIFSDNRLGLHKLVQALVTVPVLAGAVTAVEVFFVAPALPWLPVVGFGLVFLLMCALIGLDVGLARQSLSPRKLCQPDRIAISPQGLNLQWSGKCLSYIALVLPWRRVALAYYEVEPGLDGANHRRLCLRDNLGKALRFNAEVFDDQTLVHNLYRRAPWAVKAAPKILASQPTQKTRFRYLWQWLLQVRKGKKGKKENQTGKQLSCGQVVGARYCVVERMRPSFRKNLYLAEIKTKDTLSHQWLSEEHPASSSAPQMVRVQQWLLPGNISWKHFYDLFNEIERRTRLHSRANLNTINRWLDVFVENMSIFVVTEHDGAPTLREHVESKGPLSEMEAKTTAVEMIDVVSYLHKDDPLLHKNINPDSWIRLDNGKIKLDQIDADLYLTPSHFECLGIDRRYCAIDLLRGVPSIQADIYALGATLYFLVTGKDPEPFQSGDPQSVGASISPQFNAIIMRAGDIDVSRRYQSTEEMKADLLALAAQETSLLLL